MSSDKATKYSLNLGVRKYSGEIRMCGTVPVCHVVIAGHALANFWLSLCTQDLMTSSTWAASRLCWVVLHVVPLLACTCCLATRW